jgi:hypothetical protein
VKILFLSFALVVSSVFGATIDLGTTPLAVTSTFFETFDDSPTNPAIIDLTALGLKPGDTINISEVGGPICFHDQPNCVLQEPNLAAVLSSTDQLIPQAFAQFPNGIYSQYFTADIQRIPGAIFIGLPSVGSMYDPNYAGFTSTGFDSLPNVNPFSFYADNVTITLPVAPVANFLFVGVVDSYYGDNSMDNGLGVDIKLITSDVCTDCSGGNTPEPSSVLMLVSGLAALVIFKKRY